MKRAIIGLALILNVITFSSQTQEPDLRIMVVGDSLSRGLYAGTGGRYADLLAHYYEVDDVTVEVEILAVCTIKGLVNHWQEVLDYNPDVLVIELGINDLRDFRQSTEHCPLLETDLLFRQAYDYRVQLALAEGWTVAVSSIPWSGWETESDTYNKAILYNQRIDEIVAVRDVCFADLWDVTHLRADGMSGVDTLHPNDVGHQRIADEIYRVLSIE